MALKRLEFQPQYLRALTHEAKQLLKFDNEFLAYPVQSHDKINNLLDIFSLFQKKLLSKTLEKSEIQNF